MSSDHSKSWTPYIVGGALLGAAALGYVHYTNMAKGKAKASGSQSGSSPSAAATAPQASASQAPAPAAPVASPAASAQSAATPAALGSGAPASSQGASPPNAPMSQMPWMGSADNRQWVAQGYDTQQGNPGVYAAYYPNQDQPLRVGELHAQDRLCGSNTAYRVPRYGHNLTDVSGAFRYVPVGGDLYSLHQQEAQLNSQNAGSSDLSSQFDENASPDSITRSLQLKSDTQWVPPRGMEPIPAVVVTAPQNTSPVVPIAPMDIIANPDDGVDNFFDPDNGMPNFQLQPE